MRREHSISPAWFEALYAEKGDPWGFETSPYERAKYDHTLAALPQPRFARALEVGCANGALTERLAARCDALVALDVSETALARARERLGAHTGVELARMRFPAEAPAGTFDLVLLSEVAYYWDSADLARAAAWIGERLAPGGHLLMVHWTGETDYPRTADQAVAELREGLGGAVAEAAAERREAYRLDLWRRG